MHAHAYADARSQNSYTAARQRHMLGGRAGCALVRVCARVGEWRGGRWTSEGSDDSKPSTASEAKGSFMRGLTEVCKGLDRNACIRGVHAMR